MGPDDGRVTAAIGALQWVVGCMNIARGLEASTWQKHHVDMWFDLSWAACLTCAWTGQWDDVGMPCMPTYTGSHRLTPHQEVAGKYLLTVMYKLHKHRT